MSALLPSGDFPKVDFGADTNLFRELVEVWRRRRPMNLTRSVYADGEAALKDFGISLPPQMARVATTLGWTAKGLQAVTDRANFEGFVSKDGAEDPFGLEQVMWENRFEVELPAAQRSSARHGCAFLTVTQGDVASGEPEVLIQGRSAESSAAVWDARRRELAGFLSVTSVDDDGQIAGFVFYSPSAVWVAERRGSQWVTASQRNPLGRVPVAPLVYGFDLTRPLGRSRVTRASMGFVDSAIRTIVRAEVSSEFYSAPEYWLFGADVSQWAGQDKWTAVMGRIKALAADPDSESEPKLHRFEGASPQPHTEQLRMYANLFADDQDLEVKFADASNPSSADAIYAAKETLITTTRNAVASWGYGAVQAMQFAVQLRDGLDVVPDEMRSLRARYTDPAIVSPSARADAFVKLASAVPELAGTQVGLEMAGLSAEQIARFKSEQRVAQSTGLVAQLLARSGETVE